MLPAETLPIVLAIVAALLALVLYLLVRRRRAAEPAARLRRACRDLVSNVLLPDGEGGQIHIEYALLCPRGIVLINYKDVSGTIFGSDSMQEWAVITPRGRFGMRNPQNGLYDRTAAVKRIVPDLPVHGYVAFSASSEFSKGTPAHVARFDKLLAELEQELQHRPAALDAFWNDWNRLKGAMTPAPADL